jgi:hypothetical protein
VAPYVIVVTHGKIFLATKLYKIGPIEAIIFFTTAWNNQIFEILYGLKIIFNRKKRPLGAVHAATCPCKKLERSSLWKIYDVEKHSSFNFMIWTNT